MRESTSGESALPARDLQDLLLEFSVALHKYTIYPPAHPLLRTATEALVARLAVLLHDRPALALGLTPSAPRSWRSMRRSS